ncbi:MAG: diguanylate cyclase [Candidatus Omnitrophica bacterium]|nr:diguanylate cyclase [Candidatus Omnitrophota bacterium]
MRAKNIPGLRRKIWISVSLVTVIPIIILFYHFSGYYISFFSTAILGLLIALGWWIVFEVFWSIIKVTNYTRKTFERLGGEFSPLENEAKTLESIMERLSVKVKNNLEQLKMFSAKTDELNKEVSKKVFILSTISQANELVSKETANEKIVSFLVQNLKEILNLDICFCSLKENNLEEFKTISCLGVDINEVQRVIVQDLSHLSKLKKTVRIDKQNRSLMFQSLVELTGVKTLIVMPIIPRDRLEGVLGIGSNNEDFRADKECMDVLNLFTKNIALIWEHKKLSVKVKELEIFDSLTGLYNNKFIMRRLDEEIERSAVYQRPCGFMLMEISNYSQYQREFGVIEAEKLIREVANIFKSTLRPIDFIGRIDSDKIAVILIERNKRQSQQVVKDIKHKLVDKLGEKVQLSFSISETPMHGMTARELVSFAQSQIDKESKEHGI